MSALRSALILALALGSTSLFAEQITCESHGGRAEACGTVQAGSNVQMIEQLSSSPCIEGSTWGADNDSIWVSGGCRAVFDVQPRYSSTNETSSYYDNDNRAYNDNRTYNDERAYDDRSYDNRRYERRNFARDDSGRRIANNACINRISTDESFGDEEIGTSDVRRVSDDLFVVELNTPKGPATCSVDRNGIVREIDYR